MSQFKAIRNWGSVSLHEIICLLLRVSASRLPAFGGRLVIKDVVLACTVPRHPP